MRCGRRRFRPPSRFLLTWRSRPDRVPRNYREATPTARGRLRAVLDESDIEAEVRLCVPAVTTLKQHFWPTIVIQLEFREPHAFAER
jgi:hypothetical protein